MASTTSHQAIEELRALNNEDYAPQKAKQTQRIGWLLDLDGDWRPPVCQGGGGRGGLGFRCHAGIID
jgi:hypothetical protein